MGILNGIFLIVLGALCIPSLVAQKSPNAKELLDKVVPFQGIIGFVSFIWGIWLLITVLLRLYWITDFPVVILTWAVATLVLLCGGALLGWGMIQKHLLSKASENVKAKAEASFAKLVAIQPTIGLIAIGLGIWTIVATIIFL